MRLQKINAKSPQEYLPGTLFKNGVWRIHAMMSCQKYNIFDTKWNEREKVILIKISIIHLGKR